MARPRTRLIASSEVLLGWSSQSSNPQGWPGASTVAQKSQKTLLHFQTTHTRGRQACIPPSSPPVPPWPPKNTTVVIAYSAWPTEVVSTRQLGGGREDCLTEERASRRLSCRDLCTQVSGMRGGYLRTPGNAGLGINPRREAELVWLVDLICPITLASYAISPKDAAIVATRKTSADRRRRRCRLSHTRHCHDLSCLIIDLDRSQE